MHQQLDFEITEIDSGFMGTDMVSCYLIGSEGHYAIIETGNFETTERILSLLDEKKISRDKVLFVIPTHVHLDHAGGCSSLMEALPEAMLVIHPKGARHMIDPTKLIAGATVVYGESEFKKLYGEIKPIAEDRVIIAEDNSSLVFGNRTLVFRDSPGHANHHFCIWDERSCGWFTGDTFGLVYPALTAETGPFIFPTTSPVQFDPDKLIQSIEMLMSYQPKYMYLTHFGRIEVTSELKDALCQQIRDYVDIVTSQADTETTAEYLIDKLKDYTLNRLEEHGCTLSMEKICQVIDLDIKLNGHGLAIWFSRREK